MSRRISRAVRSVTRVPLKDDMITEVRWYPVRAVATFDKYGRLELVWTDPVSARTEKLTVSAD